MSLTQISQDLATLLLVDKHAPVIQEITIVSGTAALLKGATVGKITTGGKYQDYDTGETNGAEVARAVILADVDASAGDKQVNALMHGAVNQDEMLGNGGDAAARLVAADNLAGVGITVYTDVEPAT